jgi:hypothetical protein
MFGGAEFQPLRFWRTAIGFAQELDKDLQRRAHLPPARIIEEKAIDLGLGEIPTAAAAS